MRNNTQFFQELPPRCHQFLACEFSIVHLTMILSTIKTHTLKNECTCCHTGKRPLIFWLPYDAIIRPVKLLNDVNVIITNFAYNKYGTNKNCRAHCMLSCEISGVQR